MCRKTFTFKYKCLGADGNQRDIISRFSAVNQLDPDFKALSMGHSNILGIIRPLQ
jgi:hypothetical protein